MCNQHKKSMVYYVAWRLCGLSTRSLCQHRKKFQATKKALFKASLRCSSNCLASLEVSHGSELGTSDRTKFPKLHSKCILENNKEFIRRSKKVKVVEIIKIQEDCLHNNVLHHRCMADHIMHQQVLATKSSSLSLP